MKTSNLNVSVKIVGVAASAGVGAASLTTTGDINSGAGNIISGGTISGSSISTSSGSITSAGNVACGAGGNYFVGGTRLASSNLLDGSLLLNTSSSAQTKAGGLTSSGQIQGDTLISTNNITSLAGAAIINQNIQAGGDIVSTAGNMEARGGQLSLRSSDAGIVDDASRNLTVQASTASNKIFCGLGSGANKALQLDILGTKARLRLYDYTVGRDQYYDVGQNPDELVGLVALINDSDLTFNGSTTTTFDAGNTTTFNNTVLLNGTTTVGSGVTDIGKTGVTYGVFGQLETLTAKFATPVFTGVTYEANYQDVANRFPLGVFLETYGTNTKVTIRGCFEYKPGGVGTNIPVGKFATLPSGAIPTRPVIVSVQGQIGFEQGRVDIDTNGDLIYQGGGAAFGIANLSQISFFVNV